MKRALLFALLLSALLFSNRSDAQVPVVNNILPKVIIGVKLGAAFDQLNSSSFDNSYKTGIQGGAFVGITHKNIGIQVEGLVSSAKFSAKNNSSYYINSVNLNVPVLLEYRLISRLWLQLGPQFSDVLSENDNNSGGVKNVLKTTGFAGVLGLQAILPVHLVAGARYILGFTNVNNNNIPNVKDTWNDRSIQVYVGFRFL